MDVREKLYQAGRSSPDFNCKGRNVPLYRLPWGIEISGIWRDRPYLAAGQPMLRNSFGDLA